MRSHEYEKQRAREIALAAIHVGFRAFLAEKGNYGFYTDAEGTRVVSFQVNGYFEESVSGNYVTENPHKTGTGWRMTDGFSRVSVQAYFDASAPRWAVDNVKWRHATLEDHLKRYQSSSKYNEVAA